MTQEGKNINRLESLNRFANEVDKQLQAQPPAEDLDGCDEFIRLMQGYYSTVNQKASEAETLFNIKVYGYIADDKNYETYKLIKSSSTLTMAFMAGKFPNEHAVMQRLKGLMGVIRDTFNNYRTLLSSYKLVRELEQRGVNNRRTENSN